MTIHWGDLFKRFKARLLANNGEGRQRASQPRRIEKGDGPRLHKTVLPSAGRARTAAPDSFEVAASPGAIGKPAPRSSGTRELPKGMPIRMEPPVERAISLQLADILDQLPGECVKARETVDPAQTIVLRASEIEKGMASGKPSVSLASIFEQAPEIFVREIPPSDTTPVFLPYNKVLDQFNSLQVRPDQVRDPVLADLETPFLKAKLEDTERFGAAIKPPDPALAKVEPAPATAAVAESEVERVEGSTSSPRLKISIPDQETSASAPVTSAAPPEKQREDVPPASAPRKISFHLPPNGVGAPASEKVPASSGPPIPTAPTPATPSRAPFKFAPRDNIRPKFTLVPGVEPKEGIPSSAKAVPAEDSESKIALSLQTLLQEVPGFQLNGSPLSVAEDVMVEFPLTLIEPQLASGRVVVPAKLFHRAIPEMHRSLFVIDPNETPVALSLHEIVKRLPPSTLRLRNEPEVVEPREQFTTPFSIQAAEDAKRFETTNSAQTEKLDAKQAVARANALPGLTACAITFTDGLSLAGNIPAELGAEGICAMAPTVLQRIDNYLPDTKLGALVAMTLHCAESQLTFFMYGNICLTALHASTGALTAETRDQLAAMVQELSRTYSQAEPFHVDH